MNEPILAGIQFEDGEDVDTFLQLVVDRTQNFGKKVCGAIQSRGHKNGDCQCSDMDLKTIGSDKLFRISQPLGRSSKGCRLHPGALAECCAFLENEVQTGCDLLVLNRFGRGEADGRGFRDLIVTALELDVPVLIAFRAAYAAPWQDFSDGFAREFPLDLPAVEEWLAKVSAQLKAA